MHTRNHQWGLTLIIILLALAGAGRLCGQTLQMQFGFEDSGTTTTDSVAGVSLNLVDSNGAAADYHGPNSSGVYGHGQALNFSGNNMGNTGALAYSTNNATIRFGTITNCTVALWIKPSIAFPGATVPRFLVLATNGLTANGSANSIGFENAGSFPALGINTTLVNSSGVSEPANQWLFLAATWDGTTVRYYSGSETAAVALRSSFALAGGSVNLGSTFSVFLGNIGGARNRSFQGLMDDVRFYTGVASSSFLEGVRQQALVLSAPANVTLSTCGGGSLAWSAVSNAVGYIVQRSTVPGAETNYAATANNAYVDTNFTSGTTYYYKIIATNSSLASVSSSEVSGTILSGSSFTFVTQPFSQVAKVGATASFSVVINGSGFSYQWQSSADHGATWNDIPSATNPSYITPALAAADNGNQYRVMVLGGCQPVPSAVVTLTVVNAGLQFGFEDSGITTTDSLAGVSLDLVNATNGLATDYHGWDGSGVYDHNRALNFSSATPGYLSCTASTSNNPTINFGTLTNFTIAFWMKPTFPIGGTYIPRLFELNTPLGTDDITLLNYTGPWRLSLNGTVISLPSFSAPTNQWAFVALTWDGQTARLYSGTEAGAVALVGSAAATAGPINLGSAFNLYVGNIAGGDRPFMGWMDDVRFYSGLVGSETLEAIRQQSLVLPAPADMALTTCSQAALSWSAVREASGYIVKRSTVAGAESTYATTGANSFVDTNVSVGATYYYQVVATNSSQVSGSSSEVSGIIQNQALFTFVTQPTNQIVCPGDSATFSVVTSGGSGLMYLWQSSTNQGATWTDIPAATSTNYTTPPVLTTDDGTRYRVMAISSCGAVPSVVATLIVATTPPNITMQPFNQTVVAGWPAVFAVKATGANLVYQWRQDGLNLVDGNGVSGANTAVLTLTNLTVTNSGAFYDCVVGLPCVAVTSAQALLTVNADATNNLALKFDFEDATNGTFSTDSANGVTLNLAGANLAAYDLHGQPGSGVSGIGRALDLATANSSPMGGTNGLLAYVNSGSAVNFGTLGSFTVTLWVKPTAAMSGFPRFFILGSFTTLDVGSADTLGLLFAPSTPTALQMYDNATPIGSPGLSLLTNQWRFLALTWDGQTARFYTGSETNSASLLGAGAVAAGPINVGSSFNLFLGNNGNQTRSFVGLMDDVRFYVGAAPLQSIETFRQAAVPVAAPVANFSALPLSGVRPLLVTFTNLSVGSTTNLLWDFGDGSTSASGSNMLTHIYSVEGAFSAKLTASGPGGSNSATNAIAVIPPNPPKVTKLTAGAGGVTVQGINGPVSATQTYYYKLLTSTNLALPRINWTVIATNAFNADGSFSNTIPVAPGEPERFFLQQMP